MPASMLLPLLSMFLATTLLFATLLLVRARGEVLRRERNARWLQDALQEGAA
jgi:ABC-type transport system involved in cytochrome c biogenesis permease subunit